MGESTKEKMANWHDAHAKSFPLDHPYREFHEQAAKQLRKEAREDASQTQ